jgi:hypothetical protein
MVRRTPLDFRNGRDTYSRLTVTPLWGECQASLHSAQRVPITRFGFRSGRRPRLELRDTASAEIGWRPASLRILRDAGLIEAERHGTSACCWLVPEAIDRLRVVFDYASSSHSVRS